MRRQAIGTLRCVQAIVKMQALVRARRVRLSAVGLGIQEELGENIKTNNQRVNSLVMFICILFFFFLLKDLCVAQICQFNL